MAQYQAEAILLAVRDWGEADRLVTLFSREYGKIIAMAYGARRPRSHLGGSMQTFTHMDVSLLPGKGIDSIRQTQIKQTFRTIGENLDCMAYGSFLTELVAELCPERQPEPLIFDLLLGIFELLTKRNPRVVALAGAWQLLALAGYQPENTRCVSCGQILTFPAYFSADAGGGVCSDCDHQGLLEFNAEAHAFLESLLKLDWQDPGHFTIRSTVLAQTEQFLLSYLLYRLDKPLKSLNFIKQVSTI